MFPDVPLSCLAPGPPALWLPPGVVLLHGERRAGDRVEAAAAGDAYRSYAPVHERDIEHPQFAWTFQRYLYDCMHDYLVEMFLRTPQNRDDGR